eukprot:jgi/Psemu1/282752/fgenesh1_pg.13_\
MSRYTDAIQTAYGSYAESGGDGDDVWRVRGAKLGYDSVFLTRCGLLVSSAAAKRDAPNDEPDNADSSKCECESSLPRPSETTTEPCIETLFAAFCGSGCPLRIDDDRHLPREGDVVVDLGCGAGHDAILAAGLVGPTGRVVGVDFTQAMIDASVRNAERHCYNTSGNGSGGGGTDGTDTTTSFAATPRFGSLSFGKGRIDDPDQQLLRSIPGLEPGCADLVLSNGVFNLCADQASAFRAAYELLKPGGRFLLSDLCVVPENPGATIACTIGDEVTS